MSKTCLVGNIDDLPESYKYLLQTDIDVLATRSSSINSCYHLYFEEFEKRIYDECIVVYGTHYTRYFQPEIGSGFSLTPNSKYSSICYSADNEVANRYYALRLFLLLYILCKSKDIKVRVINNGSMQCADHFIKTELEKNNTPWVVDSGAGFSMYGYANSYNEYVTNLRGKENLLIVLGDSWVVADSKEIPGIWHPSYLSDSFSYYVATDLDSDLVVCGSPGNSNQGAMLNFILWYLYNWELIKEYKDVKVLFSSTNEVRDFTVNGSIGIWSDDNIVKEYLMHQSDQKLTKESIQIFKTFAYFCLYLGVEFYFILAHSALRLKYGIKSPTFANKIIQPEDENDHDYGYFFLRNRKYRLSCGHPSTEGHRFLAKEILSYIKNFKDINA